MPKKKTNFDDIKEVLDGCRIDDLPDVDSYIPTGCTTLNLAVSNNKEGGIPLGRIVQVFGGSATCKSVLGHTILGYGLRKGMESFLADVEHALDPRFALKFGLNIENEQCHIGEPEHLEQCFDHWIGGAIEIYEDSPKIMVLDSITSLPSMHELDKEMSESQSRAPRAKAISEGMRRYIRRLSETNTTLFCIDQTRQNMSGFGKAEVTTGGKGLEFYASVRIYLLHEAKIVNSKGHNIGIWVKFCVEKNRVGPPMREGNFKLLYTHGIDDISSNLRWLAENRGWTNDSDNEKSWKTSKDGKKLLEKVTLFIPQSDDENPEYVTETNSIKKWVREIEERNLEHILRDNVEEAWMEVHKSEERKERVW